MLAFKKEVQKVQFKVIDSKSDDKSEEMFQYFEQVKNYIKHFYPRYTEFEFYCVLLECIEFKTAKVGKYIIELVDA